MEAVNIGGANPLKSPFISYKASSAGSGLLLYDFLFRGITFLTTRGLYSEMSPQFRWAPLNQEQLKENL